MSNDIPLSEEIANLRGTTVSIWEYIDSHQVLVLRCRHPTRTGNMYLVCAGCRRIEVSTLWHDSNFEVLDAAPGQVVLIDKKAPAKIECRLAHVWHNAVPNFRGKPSMSSTS